LSLGQRDPEFFLRRFTYGYIGTLYTRLILESLGYETEPLDIASFNATFVAWRWSDFIDKLRRRKKYSGFMTAPDLLVKRDGSPKFIVEVSRRSGFFHFNPSTVRKVRIPGVNMIFENGVAVSFEKYVESFNVVFGDLRAPSLDRAYELIWDKIVKVSRSPRVSLDEIKAVEGMIVSRRVRYAKPKLVDTFYVNVRKLEESWKPTLEKYREQIGEFDIYYVLWMDDPQQGFVFTTLSEIEQHKGCEEVVETREERVYEVPLSICKPMYEFPPIRNNLVEKLHFL